MNSMELDPFEQLKIADEAAVEIINRLKTEKGFDLQLSFLTAAVIYGRLRADVGDGVDLKRVDDLFKLHSEAITASLEKESDSEEPYHGHN